MPDPALFHGVAVIIDDEIDSDPRIQKIQEQIEATGSYVVGLGALPDEAHLANLSGASFFIVDWNLYGAALHFDSEVAPLPQPKGLRKQQIGEVIDFLKLLRRVRFAPVFIFTNEDVEEVRNHLKKHKDIYDEDDPSHILIANKAGIADKGVFVELSDWLDRAPAAYALKKWEVQYNQAKNELFMDFSEKSPFWPIILKKDFENDGLNPSVELGNLISRNLLSRMTPFQFDFSIFEPVLEALKHDEQSYKRILLKVLEGERFLPSTRLHTDSIAPGDIFENDDNLFINIRPDCDCLVRDGGNSDAIDLYLLRGNRLTGAKIAGLYRETYGLLFEQDNEAIIFDLVAEKSFVFQFKNLTIQPWGNWKAKRIGRLLPPFLTRFQQRYAAYLQRPGLSRIPPEAIPAVPVPAGALASAERMEGVNTADVSQASAPSAKPRFRRIVNELASMLVALKKIIKILFPGNE